MKNEVKKINNLLIKRFGIPGRASKMPDPVDMIIATILSQNTNDRNSYRAFNNLKKKYENWEIVNNLSAEAIEEEIRIAGLGKQKSAAIKNLLSSLEKVRGKISLNYLKKLNDEEALKELLKYNGVGVKTASCVLLFSLGRNVCPVDTHVHRTLNRIGIVRTNLPEKTYFLLKANFPEGIAHSFHTNLIRLGREICRPAIPKCAICPLLRICRYENKNFSEINEIKENSFMLLDNV